jgi:ankyrin repeat protein
MAEILLEKGLSPLDEDSEGFTPLAIASMKNQPQMIALMKRYLLGPSNTMPQTKNEPEEVIEDNV